MAITTRRAGGRTIHTGLTFRPKVPVCRAPPVRAVQAGLPLWSIMYRYLLTNESDKFQSVLPREAKGLVDGGEYIMVDVRPAEDFEKATIEGAQSVPLFQRLSLAKPSPGKLLRGLAYALNGVQAVEVNPDFEEQMKATAGDKKVLLCCDTGGTMQPSTNFVEGKTSRSLKASFLVLKEALAPGVAHLDGGIVAWTQSGLPTVGEYDESIAGRSPNSADAATFPGQAKKD